MCPSTAHVWPSKRLILGYLGQSAFWGRLTEVDLVSGAPSSAPAADAPEITESPAICALVSGASASLGYIGVDPVALEALKALDAIKASKPSRIVLREECLVGRVAGVLSATESGDPLRSQICLKKQKCPTVRRGISYILLWILGESNSNSALCTASAWLPCRVNAPFLGDLNTLRFRRFPAKCCQFVVTLWVLSRGHISFFRWRAWVPDVSG